MKRKKVEKSLATYIAEKCCEYTTSVREAIRIARLSKTKKEVDKNIETIMKYR
ncbi:MAG: hypothetical protein ACUVXA_03640 [Candidatus Jordarchaeum sp.]|uniref:hypothetical protein n=1 Tax=Candidatus Jordarchaeum sp. TaxID=2823881 RepID=UPI00404B5F0B